MKPKLIYHASSFSEFIWSLLLRLACVFAIAYLLMHFEENRVVISVLIGVCLLFIFILGDDQIFVYSDRVVHSTNSLASILFKTKGKSYEIREIEKAYLKPKPEEKMPNALEIGVIVLLVAILPKRRKSHSTTNPIFFDTKAGKRWQINTDLSEYEMKKVVETVNHLVRSNSS